MIRRMLASLLLLTAFLRAEDGPGILVQGSGVGHLAQDANGTVWGINEGNYGGEVAVLVDARWDRRAVPGLHHRCHAMAIDKLDDGDVACLWHDGHEAEDHWILTRHRAGQSRVVQRFRATLIDPVLMGTSDGRVFVTGTCDTVVVLPSGPAEPEIIKLPAKFFLPPDKPSDERAARAHATVRALSDASGKVWLWSPASVWRPRLNGLVEVGRHGADLKLRAALGGRSRLSQLQSWDERHFVVGVPGDGLFLMAKDDLKLEPMPVPDPEAFKYVEQLFHDGTAWNAVTMPRPEEYEDPGPRALSSYLALRSTIFYDPTKPTCALWRWDMGRWRRVHEGLDRRPAYLRPWLRTPAGLFLGTYQEPPWFFPADGGKPRHLASNFSFPLSAVSHMFALPNNKVLLCEPNSGKACLWPADAPPVPEQPARWQALLTKGQALQDSRGHIWFVRGDGTFTRWNGASWDEMPSPPAAAVAISLDFIPDDRDRGWLLPADDEATAIFDFKTGKWHSFPSLREALVAQLPQGVRLKVPERPFYEPAFSPDGRRIGGFVGLNRVWLYAKGRWREWYFYDIAGPEETLAGTPFFAPNGLFTVPSWRANFQWHDDTATWNRAEGVSVPSPGASRRVEETELPDGTVLREDSDDYGVRDRFGVIWLVRKADRTLYKLFAGREVRALAANEPNPFRRDGSVYRALVDDAGNALLRCTSYDGEHTQIWLPARLPAPESVARLSLNEADTVRVSVGGSAAATLWHTWRVDGGPWQPLRESRELTVTGLAPGKHTVEVRAFNADLNAAPKVAVLSFITSPAADAQLAASLRDLASPSLETRESAARTLKNQGPAALPKLRAARDSAPTHVQWWLDAVIQHIERQTVPK